MKIGNVSLNPEAFKDYTKERFFEEYAGKLAIDKEEVWKQIEAINNAVKSADEFLNKTKEVEKNMNQALNEAKNESIGITSKQSKKPDGNRINKGSSGE